MPVDADAEVLTNTRLSGGLMAPEVVAAMAEAARCLVLLERDLPRAEALALEAAARSARVGLRPAAIADAQGLLRQHQGRPAEAAELFEQARLQARRAGDVMGEFDALEQHQSYPGRLHGGMASTMLDETIGRAIMMRYPEVLWGVTVDFQTRFKKSIPLNVELRVVGRITSDNSRFFEGTGEILLPDATIAATGYGKYIKLPLEKISDFDHDEQEWRVVPSAYDPIEIDY